MNHKSEAVKADNNKRLQPLTMSASAPSQTVYSIGYDLHAGNGMAGDRRRQ
jgi:hypothetical protein